MLVGHDHLALVIQFDDLPVFVSEAVQEVCPDEPFHKLQDGVSVKTRWFFDEHPYWGKLTIPATGRQASIEYVRAIDDVVRCSILLETGRAMRLQEDCAQSSPL